MGFSPADKDTIDQGIDLIAEEVARVETSKGFYDEALLDGDPDELVQVKRGYLKELVITQKIALVHSELSEMLEALRKDPDAISKKIPPFTEVEDEGADVIIRLLGIGARLGLNLGPAVVAKSEFNETRPHKHGKRF